MKQRGPGGGEERLRGADTSVGSYFADINEIEISMEITARYLVDLSGARSPSQTEVGGLVISHTPDACFAVALPL